MCLSKFCSNGLIVAYFFFLKIINFLVMCHWLQTSEDKARRGEKVVSVACSLPAEYFTGKRKLNHICGNKLINILFFFLPNRYLSFKDSKTKFQTSGPYFIKVKIFLKSRI